MNSVTQHKSRSAAELHYIASKSLDLYVVFPMFRRQLQHLFEKSKTLPVPYVAVE